VQAPAQEAAGAITVEELPLARVSLLRAQKGAAQAKPDGVDGISGLGGSSRS